MSSGGEKKSGGEGAATAPAAKPLHNTDFRAFLTPMHPAMGGAKPPAAAAAAAGFGGGATPLRSAPPGELKTVKLSKHGVRDAEADGVEYADGGDEGCDDDGGAGADAAPSGAPRQKGERVLSSRERSFLAYQAKQAAKLAQKTKYRDRAKERQQGANPDYDPLLESVSAAGVVAPEELSVEASKFLGGDAAHTHLVKGLDFALLAKVREEIERKEEEKMEAIIHAQMQQQHKAPADEADMEDAAVAAAAAAEGAESAPKALTPAQQAAKHGMVFHTSLATSIYNLVCNASSAFAAATAAAAAAPVQSDLFLPGRMSFDFPLVPAACGLIDTQSLANALPTTTLVSRSDLDAFAQSYAEEHAQAALPPQLHDRLSALFLAQKHDADERKLKRKRRGEEAEAGFNVEKGAAAAAHAVAASSGGKADPAIVSEPPPQQPPADAPMYTVERPPPAEDSDDDDIFAGAGTEYNALATAPLAGPALPPADDEEADYSVPRPPPSPTEDMEDAEQGAAYPAAATTAAAVGPMQGPPRLFAKDASVPQLDPRASRMQDAASESEEEEEEDIFGATRAGDELLGDAGAAAAGKELSAAEKARRRNAMLAEAEYGALFPGAETTFALYEDDEDGDDDDDDPSKSKAAKLKAKRAAEEAAAAAALPPGSRGSKTPLHRGGLSAAEEEEQARRRDARFDAEYSQVASLLQQRGVKLNDDPRGRAAAAQTTPRSSLGAKTPARKDTSMEDDERAIKRQRILKGFAKR